jgi:EamA domain-containing membrane protein RarD
MRKLGLIIGIIFAIIGIVFTVLPMGTLALIPIGIAIIFSGLAFVKSDVGNKNVPKWILIIAILSLIIVVGKELFIKDEVAKDEQFEQKKIESKQEDLKDLEGLE